MEKQNYFGMKAYFAALEYEQVHAELAKSLRRKDSTEKLLALMAEHDRKAHEVKEFDRIARSRIKN
jgi:hypothetical protein